MDRPVLDDITMLSHSLAPLQITCCVKQCMPQDLRDFGPIFWYWLQKSTPCQSILQNPKVPAFFVCELWQGI